MADTIDPIRDGLTLPQLLDLFDGMVRARETEDRLEALFNQGHVPGGVYRSLGQEAGSVGACYALRRRTDGTGDCLAQTVRATGGLFLFGATPLEYLRQYLGRGTSPTGGKDANVHFTDFDRGIVGTISPLGTMIGVMAGITLAFRFRGEDRVGIAFYGDGATSTGAWHEGLSMAAAQKCPMILMVVHNHWAFSTPTRNQTRVKSFTEKAAAYGVQGASVDGNDVVETYHVVKAAAARARAGQGVQLIELRTYRRKGHAQHDAAEYVDPGELEAWTKRDPIDGFRTRLLDGGWATAAELDERHRLIHHEIQDAAEQAVGEPHPRPESALGEVYTDHSAVSPWTRAASVTPPFGVRRAM